MRSKWLRFLLVTKGYKTSVWRVENKANDILGLIKWHPQWRQYCFITHSSMNYDLIYSTGCLEDIVKFIKKLMEERKKKRFRIKRFKDGWIVYGEREHTMWSTKKQAYDRIKELEGKK